ILKIDRSFFDDAASDQDDGPIVRAIVAMAKCLRLKVFAEGVESEAQARLVTQCHSVNA
ncbi:MAG: EAL domain-containing protein, partial [Shimia sp.]|nr:EAL domain-containing protein [Shimia sp.]